MHLAELLKYLLHQLQTGQPISVAPTDELELRAAAAWLGISPSELVRLGEEGLLPSHQVESRLVLYREDVQA
ncbi:hypothetical protein [Deinococcus sp. QL22]|uniref:hypothetical protein n=1 Tax=Deinococcus sp. QL22 TaxID=2939437 RepID=UPI002017823F|nr:hypothetical protein [Deinococcus sp. QL22]UQN09361.1 hypothetical protein M1R55_22635 [Deinococcus sp. QL22]